MIIDLIQPSKLSLKMEVANIDALWVVFFTQSKSHDHENVKAIENHPKVIPWDSFYK